MNDLDWNDLRLFIHVARGGGLSAARATTSVSAATIGRRMLALEKATGRTLFLRRQSGYALTPDGRALLARALVMEAGARPIADWLSAEAGGPVVRISAGTWTANFLATRFFRLWTPADRFRIGFKTTEARLDIAHREVEIGIRNAAPEGASLAARRTGEVAYAPYRARRPAADAEPAASADAEPWVAIAPEDLSTRSTRWVLAQPGVLVAAWANTPRTLRDLVRAGVGRGLLPCFAGDTDPQLERAGPPVETLREGQWIVMHDDDRHRPEVRAVIDRMTALLEAEAPLMRGERPPPADR